MKSETDEFSTSKARRRANSPAGGAVKVANGLAGRDHELSHCPRDPKGARRARERRKAALETGYGTPGHAWDAIDAHYAMDGAWLDVRFGEPIRVDPDPAHPIIASVPATADALPGDEGDHGMRGEAVRFLSTTELMKRCRVPAAEARFRWHFHDEIIYELLRRACLLEDEIARECAKQAMRDMVAASVAAYQGWDATGLDVDELVDRIFDTAWKRLRPEKFVNYPNALALLAMFRKTLPAQVILDLLRQQSAHPQVSLPDSEDQRVGPRDNTQWDDSDPISDEARGETRRYVLSRARDEQERIILRYMCFGQQLKSAEVFARFPELFEDVQQVYRSRENLFVRLKRDPEMARLFERVVGHSPKNPPSNRPSRGRRDG